MADHPLTLWTIRLSLACYVLTLAGRLWRPRSKLWPTAQRLLWTAGCVLLVAHIASAFHFHHRWSHSHAMAETARQTRELIGWEFGGGVYFNYLFAAVWTVDVAGMWLGRASYEQRPAWLAAALHAYLLFIAFNGAVVFETGPTRWFGIAASIGLAALATRRVFFGQSFKIGDSHE